jgi:soluble lytic murein transglycosylase-like protein
MWDELIRKYAAVYQIPESWIHGVIQAESGGNPDASNPSDPSYGLMGLMMPTAKDMGYAGTASGLFDPDTNVNIGSKYLAWISSRFKTTNPAEIYSAFNSGSPTRYTTSSQVASNVERFLRFAASWETVAVASGGGLVIVSLLALFIWKKRK